MPRTEEQLLESEKSETFAPVMLIGLLIATVLLPVFESVMVCIALAVPTLCGAKFRLVGEI